MTVVMWFFSTEVKVFLSLIDDTQDGSWECQTTLSAYPASLRCCILGHTQSVSADLFAILFGIVDLFEINIYSAEISKLHTKKSAPAKLKFPRDAKQRYVNKVCQPAMTATYAQ
jgi:hypothetical protein